MSRLRARELDTVSVVRRRLERLLELNWPSSGSPRPLDDLRELDFSEEDRVGLVRFSHDFLLLAAASSRIVSIGRLDLGFGRHSLFNRIPDSLISITD